MAIDFLSVRSTHLSLPLSLSPRLSVPIFVSLSSVPSGLSLVQSSKRSHMHLSSSALGNGPAGLHYPVTPCHYSNQQATYGMMAGKRSRWSGQR